MNAFSVPVEGGSLPGVEIGEGLPVVFLHAGVFHLVSNMYFLLIFGDAVEDTIGVARYLLLLFSRPLASRH